MIVPYRLLRSIRKKVEAIHLLHLLLSSYMFLIGLMVVLILCMYINLKTDMVWFVVNIIGVILNIVFIFYLTLLLFVLLRTLHSKMTFLILSLVFLLVIPDFAMSIVFYYWLVFYENININFFDVVYLSFAQHFSLRIEAVQLVGIIKSM